MAQLSVNSPDPKIDRPHCIHWPLMIGRCRSVYVQGLVEINKIAFTTREAQPPAIDLCRSVTVNGSKNWRL